MTKITRTIGRTALITGLALLAAGCWFVSDKDTKKDEEQVTTTRITDYAGFPFELVYRGMPNKENFSLSSGHYSSVNDYYTAKTNSVIYFNKKNFQVLEVTPEIIKLKLVK